ncbi:protein TolB [Rickettsiales bacterium]|nr:protein TolB [Rickettsiales bacterium]
MKIKLLLLLLLLRSADCLALLEIDISEPSLKPLSISIVNLNNPKQNLPIIHVMENNLQNSGVFKLLQNRDSMLDQDNMPRFDLPKEPNLDLLVTVESSMQSDLEVKIFLWDMIQKTQLIGKSLSASPEDWRYIAHAISDIIYEASTGAAGYFGTRIAYVAEIGPQHNRIKRIAMMDQDGHNQIYLTDGSNLVAMPRFSSDGRGLIYLSYASHTANPKLRIIDLETEEEKVIEEDIQGKILSLRGAPKSARLLISIFSENAANIYIMDLATLERKQVTFEQSSINSSPSFSPDESKIAFSSDREDGAQLYIMDVDGTNLYRISSEHGTYSAPVWSPNGEFIAFSKTHEDDLYLGIIKPDGSEEQIIAQGNFAEGLAWSPNSRQIIFTQQEKRSRVNLRLYSIDIVDGIKKTIDTSSDPFSPDWLLSLR